MRSITNVLIGFPVHKEDGILIPIRMTYTDDATDDLVLPRLNDDFTEMYLTYKTMQGGTAVVRDSVMELMDEMRNDYAASGFEKYQDAVEKFLTTTNFEALANGWFEDPESMTIH
jgi:hypothetical protein